MKKRNIPNQDNADFLKFKSYPLGSSSPTKSALLDKEGLGLFMKRQRTIVQLPKIFPIHNSNRQKRYAESCVLYEFTGLNLRGTKCNKRESINLKKQFDQSTIDIIEDDRQKFNTKTEKVENLKQSFLESILLSNYITKVNFPKKTKIKVFIDDGNNSRLINELMRRRTNLKIVSNKHEANIVWSPFCDWQIANLGSTFTELEHLSKNITEKHKQLKKTLHPTQESQNLIKKNKMVLKEIEFEELKMHNHLKNHYEISDKKCLFKNIRKYCELHKLKEEDLIPKTYHIEGNAQDLPLNLCEKNRIWIVKPGEDTNRGCGITIEEGRQNIIKAIKNLETIGKSSLVQEYIDPLLYKNRKFDIRCYALVTTFRGVLKAYWHKEGYIRTCSKEFSYDPTNIVGHLTNDAIQKKYKDYGKYQQCNKLSYGDLDSFLKSKDLNFEEINERMKKLAYQSIKSAEDKLQDEKNIFAFEIFGYDFLIDSKGKVWLIEINTNPCLEFSGSLLSRIIWHMVENTFAIAIDPFLQNIPQVFTSSKEKFDKIYQENKFQCLF